MSNWSRRLFLAGTAGTTLAAPRIAHARVGSHRMRLQDDGGVYEGFPASDPDDVRSIVGMSHSNLEGVTELVTKKPTLAKASWDWGFGDWESALGAASHVGRPDIVEVLVAHGARPNLFTFAMLGQIDAVRAICEANPGIQRIPGPHGISLLTHAQLGGDNAADVHEYLESLGDADHRPPRDELPDDMKAAIMGAYKQTGFPSMEVKAMRNGAPGISIGGGSARGLTHVGDYAFYPAGASAVRINFNVQDGRAVTITIHDGDLVVTARRIED